MKIERCPDYCPFLVKKEFYCQLFDKQLIFSDFIIKCEECMNADVRKSQYKKKVKDFERRQQMWDKALKRHPSKIWQQLKVRFSEWKERKEIKEFFMLIAKEFPILLDKKTTKLLMNLYLTLDGSERNQMKEILTNPKTAALLIKFVQNKEGQKDILKLVRQKMDSIEQEQKKMKEYIFERIRSERQKIYVSER